MLSIPLWFRSVPPQTKEELLEEIKTVDGPTSGLDADLLDGHDSSYFEPADGTLLKQADVDDTPVDGALNVPISSNWAFDHLSLWHTALNDIGEPGQLGFGVGLYPGSLPVGFSALSDTNDKADTNYGNYQYSDGSIMCWIPAFYYRIAHPDNPTYPTYGVNSVDIKPESAFADIATANASGYALHRAFFDGDANIPKRGFFVDKYQISNNGGTASSLPLGIPLTTASTHNPIAVLTGTPSNTVAGCIQASKTRGSSFFVPSIFIYSALALLSLAHGQAANGTAFCAWYLANKNYPKGNNNNALADSDDTSVTFTSNGHVTYPLCAKTGSGDLFAKTTHNGQNSGVSDLNGNLYEVALGMTCVATSKTITAATKANPCQITIVGHGYQTGQVIMITSVVGMTQLNDKLYTLTRVNDDAFTLDGVDSSGYTDFTSGASSCTSGTFYVAKTSTAMKDFTSGNTLATDHWGATGVAALMEPITLNFATVSGSNGLSQRYGNSTNQVLSEGVSGTDWILTGSGMPKSGWVSSSGTNLFGLDLFYQYVRNEMCLISSGYWGNISNSGVWYRHLHYSRASSNHLVGCRCAAFM